MIKHKGTVTIETKNLILRALKVRDAKHVFDNWTSDNEVAEFMRWNVHTNIEMTKEWLKECEQSSDDITNYSWGIILKDTLEPIGSIGAFISEKEPDKYEIGYGLAKKYWGKGYTKESLSRIMKFLIKEVGIKHFICMHAKENPASGAVMRSVGFVYAKDGSYKSFDGLREYDSEVYYLDID